MRKFVRFFADFQSVPSAPFPSVCDFATLHKRLISGIELAEKIKKAQLKKGKLVGRSAAAPAIWAAVPADSSPRNDSQLARRLTAQKFAPEPLILHLI
jgi:hypothetical protein